MRTQKKRSKLTATTIALALCTVSFNAQKAMCVAETELNDGIKYYKARKYGQALDRFESALSLGNGSAEVYLYIANSQAGLGNKGEAIKRFRQIAQIFKGLPAEATAKKALLQLDPQNKFIDTTPKSASELPAKSDPYVERGMALLKQKNFSGARASFEYRLSKVPNDEEALYYKALCYHYEGNRAKAVEGYKYLATHFRDTEKCKQALKHLEKLSPGDWKVLAAVPTSAPADFVSTSGKYKDKRIVLSDEQYKKEYAAIPKQTEVAVSSNISAGEHAVPAMINGKQFHMRVRGHEWETLISTNDAKHAGLPIPPGKPDSFEKNEFSEANIPVWKTACEISIGGVRRKVPVSIAEDNIGAPRLGRAFFEDLKLDGTYNKLVLSKKSDKLDVGKQAQIIADKGDYDVLPDTAEIRFTPGDHGHMMIDAYINGKLTHCMFDTGANEFFSLDQLAQCGILIPKNQPPDGMTSGWAGKPVAVWTVSVPVKVGSITRTLDVRAAHEGVAMPLIGQGFIRDFQYSIDRSGGRMTLWKKSSKLAKEQSKETHSLYDVPCTVENDREYVSVTVNGRAIGPMLVDTGASSTIMSKGLASAAGIVIPGDAPYYTIGGVGGALPVRQVTVDLRLGPVLKQDFPIFIGGTGMSAIGQDFMSGWRFSVDRDRQQLRFFH